GLGVDCVAFFRSDSSSAMMSTDERTLTCLTCAFFAGFSDWLKSISGSSAGDSSSTVAGAGGGGGGSATGASLMMCASSSAKTSSLATSSSISSATLIGSGATSVGTSAADAEAP